MIRFMIIPIPVGKYFGPLHFSRHDLVAQTIMRGRDYGLPDYNTVRVAIGLSPVRQWHEINPWLNRTQPEVSQMLEILAVLVLLSG